MTTTLFAGSEQFVLQMSVKAHLAGTEQRVLMNLTITLVNVCRDLLVHAVKLVSNR